MSANAVSSLLSQLAVASPTIVIALIGIVVAIILRPRCPTASILAILALVLLIGVNISMPVVNSVLIDQRAKSGFTNSQFSTFMSVTGFIASAARAGSMVLLIAAVFAGRRTADTSAGRLPPAQDIRAESWFRIDN